MPNLKAIPPDSTHITLYTQTQAELQKSASRTPLHGVQEEACNPEGIEGLVQDLSVGIWFGLRLNVGFEGWFGLRLNVGFRVRLDWISGHSGSQFELG